MYAILLTLAMYCGGDCSEYNEAPDVRAIVEQRLYEDGYKAKFNVRYWSVITSRDANTFWFRGYVFAVVLLCVVIGCAYAIQDDLPGPFIVSFVVGIIALFWTVKSGMNSDYSCHLQDRWRALAYKCERLERELELSTEPPSETFIAEVDAIRDEMLAIENDEPVLADPDAEREIMVKVQKELDESINGPKENSEE